MKPDFSGETVLVTGASRGIGLGIARAFAAAGADLHMLADDPAVEPAAIELGAKGHVADITDEAALAGVFSAHPEARHPRQQCRPRTADADRRRQRRECQPCSGA